jgi:hypothetical protein
MSIGTWSTITLISRIRDHTATSGELRDKEVYDTQEGSVRTEAFLINYFFCSSPGNHYA